MPTFTTSWVGQSLENGRFLVGEKLGEGGMAIVFKAQDLTTNIDVVIKVPKQSTLEDKTFLKRFAAENRALMNLKHPHVVSILHVGEFESWPFAVLQYLSGGDLEACRRKFNGKLSLLNVSMWLPKIADALDFIHDQGYVHRDVKPSNVLFDGQGQAFLSDFGVAKVVSDQASKMTNLTGTGMVLGTPDYMAPELIMGKPIDGRVDQYALAMTIYECLAGRLPFRAPTPAAILVMQTTQKVPPLNQLNPDLPEAVSQIVMRALAKKPSERFPSCRVFAEQLFEAIEPNQKTIVPSARSKSAPKVNDSIEAVQIDTKRQHSQRQTVSRAPAKRRRKPTRGSVWQNKQRLFAGGAATLIVALLIVMVIVRSLQSPDDSGIAQETSPSLASTHPAVSNSSPPERPAFTVGTLAGQEWAGNGLGMTFCWCPPGTFLMGDSSDQIPVLLSQGFWLGQCEVTQGQWQQIMGTTPWTGKQYATEDPNCAASYLDWNAAAAFCKMLTLLERQAGRLPLDWEYALPAEAQWEYACRAGTKTTFSFGSDLSELNDYGWWGGLYGDGNAKSEQYPHPIGQKKPNPWGLYDVHGNVWEWCADIYQEKPPGGTDPLVSSGGSNHVHRSGSWLSHPSFCTSAFRGGYAATSSSSWGFRVACVSSRSAKPTANSQNDSLSNAGTQAGQERIGNGLGMAFCWCPPGKFPMGGQGGNNNNPVQVTLTQGFWLGKHEVTQGEWQQVMGTTPWMGQEYVMENADHAASYVSWTDVSAFCQKLTDQERQAGRLPKDWEFTLPTEAQWEYACRAGTTTAYSFGDDEGSLSNYGWWGGKNGQGNAKTESYPHAVGKRLPNPWGFHDMHGNVWEWCRDWHASELPGGIDPEVTVQGPLAFRVDRGGGWDSEAWYCRSDVRGRGGVVVGYHFMGFRVACVSTPTSKPTSDPTAPKNSSASISSTSPKAFQPEAGTRAGQERNDNSLGMVLCWCPPGTFQMGNPKDHVAVTLSQGFWFGKCEVTQGEWQPIMGTTPWKDQEYVKEGPDYPASFVNWGDAVTFCQKLTSRERQAGRLPANWEYALPTEAQWEYACRAGSTTTFSFGSNENDLSEYGWWGGLYGDGNASTEQYPHQVGQKKQNSWGLQDMHGNTWEWCFDIYQNKLPGGTDPRVSSGDANRVYRGGSWLSAVGFCTSAFRGRFAPVSNSAWGLRVACVPSAQ